MRHALVQKMKSAVSRIVKVHISSDKASVIASLASSCLLVIRIYGRARDAKTTTASSCGGLWVKTSVLVFNGRYAA